MLKIKPVVFLATVLVVGLLAGCASQSTTPSPGSPISVEGGVYQDIAPGELAEMLAGGDVFFVNTHIPYEGELEATDAFIPFNEIEQRLNELPADRNARIVLYCYSGGMSALAAEVLVKAGYTDLWNLKGGMVAWEAEGLAVLRR